MRSTSEFGTFRTSRDVRLESVMRAQADVSQRDPLTKSSARHRSTQSIIIERTRHGYTHDAIVTREVLEEYVQAVANDPEAALEHAGIRLKPLDLQQMPNLFKFFPYTWYEDYFSSILWVKDVAPRDHDATCLALTMRLREGKH